ncbi:hypothetical protein Goari_005664, partial [Gossypium aridum]|nr:hypothetical protein [Gossypium aridum]
FSTKKISVLLDDSNYLLWRQQIFLAVKAHKLQRFLESIKILSPSFFPMAVVVVVRIRSLRTLSNRTMRLRHGCYLLSVHLFYLTLLAWIQVRRSGRQLSLCMAVKLLPS